MVPYHTFQSKIKVARFLYISIVNLGKHFGHFFYTAAQNKQTTPGMIYSKVIDVPGNRDGLNLIVGRY